ncbi:2Fe-2S iron-sulfur cluster-binding protein [Streptomyces sp. S.PB5]|uniref:2Fe-2S iron-sulfur cluster-binding protein n=1 Tax=Streptomyces sp. S.PB5 TaxID=3020844 RepID=UPI0025B04642|nr:2Fe-2S iron-sulfur cluster-binding protein [Streptomyces sp. S.PB5]MDN3028642.1 2Fe-2S iron-sulfur cluster-binding protein [Streptomyces sp. S.PB5]
MTDDRHGEGTPPPSGGRWDPLPQGDYDDGATAFVKLPEGGIDALLASDSPLAARGHGYVPPQIAVAPGGDAGTDPAATGTWAVPADGVQWPDPNALPHGGQGGQDGQGGQGAGSDRFTYNPGATGQWNFGEHAEHSERTEHVEAAEVAPAPGHDVTGQWSIPVANGDLPDESGEFTTSALVEQWGGTPPATLPGGAPAPWATQTQAGQPWGTETPGAGQAPGQSTVPGQEHGGTVGDLHAHVPGGDAHGHGGPADEGHAHVSPGDGHAHMPSGDPQGGPAGDGQGEAAGVAANAHAHVPSTDTLPHDRSADHTGAHPVADAPDTHARVEAGPAAHDPGHSHGSAETHDPAGPHGSVPQHGHAPAEPPTDTSGAAASQPSRDADEAAAAAEGPEGAQGAVEAAEGAAQPRADHSPSAPAETDTESGPEAVEEHATAADSDTPDEPAPALPGEEHPLASYVLRVNGVERPVADAWIGESLLYVLRERLGLAGAKDGCSQGECGACNVQVDGRLVASCLVPAVTAAGSEVRTVEGLAEGGQPSDVQRALAKCGAVQCGFCVPGMAMTVHDLLEGNPAPTELETRQALCGNLCRCSGYRGVVDAVKEVVAEREAHAAAEAESDGDEARIPHQAGPGAGGVNPSAFEPPHDQAYGTDGGQA